MIHRLALPVLALPLVLMGSAVASDEGTLFSADPEVHRLIVELADADYERREEATSALLTMEELTDADLGAALRRAKAPERRHRLIRVAMHRYYARMNPTQTALDRGRGAMGTDLAPENIVRPEHQEGLGSPGMLIHNVRVGFPAYAHLRPGDIVTAIGGEPFDDGLDHLAFQQRIQRYAVGDEMSVTFLRDGRERTVTFRLDSYERLNGVSSRTDTIPHPSLYQPWQRHLATLLGDDGDHAPVIELDHPD